MQKGNIQHLVWDNPHYVFLSGNSFACAHTTSKIAEMTMLSGEQLTLQSILNNFKDMAIKRHPCLPDFTFPKLPFDIQNAAIFPFTKEMHSLIRYSDLLDFKIMDVYDTKYSTQIGSNTAHLMNDASVPSYMIKNINSIDYDNFDTLILGHMDELSVTLKNANFVTDLIANALYHGKKIFSFDDITKYGFFESDNLYFPTITKRNTPSNRLGMLYRNALPVVGIFGTSSKQGKFTLQLTLRKLLLEQGYAVGEIGTEPTSQLFGMDHVFPMGYHSTVYINYDDTINFINAAMHDICTKNKDIIIVGSQSGTIPYDYGNISQFPTFQYSFLLGTLPDCIILCVNLFDSFEYIHRTIAFLESTVNSKVIALATIPFATKNKTYNSFKRLKTLMPADDFLKIQGLFTSEFHIPLYNITEYADMKTLTYEVIDFFSVEGDDCCAQ